MPAHFAVISSCIGGIRRIPIKLQKPTIACCEFTILAVAQLGGIGDPTNCACAHDRKLRCRNGLQRRLIIDRIRPGAVVFMRGQAAFESSSPSLAVVYTDRSLKTKQMSVMTREGVRRCNPGTRKKWTLSLQSLPPLRRW